MKEKENYEDLLKNLLEEVQSIGGRIRSGCSEEFLDAYWDRVEEKLGCFPPAGYYEFLRQTNGLVWEDVTLCYAHDPASPDPEVNQIHAAGEFIAVNLHYRRAGLPAQYLVLGTNDEGLLACASAGDVFAVLDVQDFSVLVQPEAFTDLFHHALEGVEGEMRG